MWIYLYHQLKCTAVSIYVLSALVCFCTRPAPFCFLFLFYSLSSRHCCVAAFPLTPTGVFISSLGQRSASEVFYKTQRCELVWRQQDAAPSRGLKKSEPSENSRVWLTEPFDPRSGKEWKKKKRKGVWNRNAEACSEQESRTKIEFQQRWHHLYRSCDTCSLLISQLSPLDFRETGRRFWTF